MTSPSDDDIRGREFGLRGGVPTADRAAWRALVARALGERDFDEALRSRSREGLDLQPLYDRADARVAGAATRNDAGWTARRGLGKFAKASISHPAAANQALLRELASQVYRRHLVLDPASSMPPAWRGRHLASVAFSFSGEFAGRGVVVV